MQLRLAALIATYVIAITAVFVIWPAVGTAPWEISARCEAALEVRNDLRISPPTGEGLAEQFDPDEVIRNSERYVDEFC